MLVKKKLEETIELKLPAFFQRQFNVYMITEAETIVSLWRSVDHGILLSTYLKDSRDYKDKLDEVLQGSTITEYDFLKVWHNAMDHLDLAVKPHLKN